VIEIPGCLERGPNNHFHGVSSSSEAPRDVCGQTDQDTKTTGTSVVFPSSVGVDVDMSGEITSGVTDSNFPHMPPRKTVVFNYYTLVSDDLIPLVSDDLILGVSFRP
jgi:hypothetical protein